MKWALVLSGGGARGLAHIGVLEALEEMGVPKPNLITGCSMGAIIGGLYATGMTPAEMRQFFGKSFDPSSFMTNAAFPNSRGPLSKAFRMGKGLTNLFSANGIDSGEKMLSLLLNLTNGVELGQTRIPFYCNSTDLFTGKEVVLEKGPIANAMRASSSFPGAFTPFPYESMLLVDGYLMHNTPVWIARSKGFKNVLAINLDEFEKSPKIQLRNTIEVLMRSIDCAVSTKKAEKRDIPTTHILASNDRLTYDFDRPDLQINFGYEKAMNQRKDIELFFAKGIRGFLGRKKLRKMEYKGIQK